MLTLVLQTRNEGRALDAALRDLTRALRPEDRLVVIDAGSSDDTLLRLKGFVQDHSAALIALDRGPLHQTEALHLGAQNSDQPWIMTLQASDRLLAGPLDEARGWLAGSAADVMVLNSGFWLTRPAQPLLRVDAARVCDLAPEHGADLPADLPVDPQGPQGAPSPADLAQLLPDPTRLIFARSALPALSKAPPWQIWQEALIGAKQALFQPKATLLHKWRTADPLPVWQEVHDALQAMPRDQIAVQLDPLLLALGEALIRGAPADLQRLILLAVDITRGLPRRMRPRLRGHASPAGALFDALHKGGSAHARAELALQAAHQQHLLNQVLLEECGALQEDLEAALPGPEYLRALYARVRPT